MYRRIGAKENLSLACIYFVFNPVKDGLQRSAVGTIYANIRIHFCPKLKVTTSARQVYSSNVSALVQASQSICEFDSEIFENS